MKRGDLLATLDDTRYAAALAQAKGQMENLRQALAKLVAGSRPEEIAQAKATMDALQTTYMNNEATYKRYADLAASNAGTIQQRDDAKAAFESVRQQYEAARQAYVLAVEGPRVEDIAAARAAYQAAEAATALAQRQFDDTRLYAPSDGVVEDRILEPGDMASPATPVLTIALLNPLWVQSLRSRERARPHPPRHEGERDRRQLSRSRLRRLDRLHLAHRRVHPQDGGDAGTAHRAGLPAQGLRLRRARRAAARDAGHRAHRSDPARCRRRRPGCGASDAAAR